MRTYSEAKVMSPPKQFDLPPWGVLDESLDEIILRDTIPKDWNASEASWRDWFEGIVIDVGTWLWPPYKPSAAVWDTPETRLLNDRDFELLELLHPALDEPISAIAPTDVTHRTYFLEEDPNGGIWGSGYSRYDATLSPSTRQWIVELIDTGLTRKAGTVDLQLKKVMQRPRPWQLALLQGRTRFGYHMAESAYTPSLISGHCFQSLMSCACAFSVLAKELGQASLQVFQQFTVDIGDRRVFAGVHYPSDNLSSWFTALRLVPYVFDASVEKSVRTFLWEAISHRSRVYAEIRKDLAKWEKRSPYFAIVSAIREAAEGSLEQRRGTRT